MPLDYIKKVKKKQIEDIRGKKTCTYCRARYRENIAADKLVKEGFNAVTLDGIYSTWNQT